MAVTLTKAKWMRAAVAVRPSSLSTVPFRFHPSLESLKTLLPMVYSLGLSFLVAHKHIPLPSSYIVYKY